MDLLRQLKIANNERCSAFGHELNDWSLTDWGCALAGEAGELCNVLKKIHRGDMSLFDANQEKLIANEAADIVIYLDLLCQRAGVNLSHAITDKFNAISAEKGSDITIYSER
jgi:NTP pyrophosphatase (non-canonical NTP hydrolase)